MTRIRDLFLTLAAAAVLLQTLASTSIASTVTQTVQQVLVTNTTSRPVPVTLHNNPSVKINNPASTPVWARINNPPATPVWVRDVNEARQPYQASYEFTINPDSYGWGGLPALTVPSGKRLVLEYASFRLLLPSNQYPQDGPTIEVETRGQRVEYHLPPALYSGSLGGTDPVYVTSAPVKLYADPGTTVGVGAGRSALTGTAYVRVRLSGYLVNVP